MSQAGPLDNVWSSHRARQALGRLSCLNTNTMLLGRLFDSSTALSLDLTCEKHRFSASLIFCLALLVLSSYHGVSHPSHSPRLECGVSPIWAIRAAVAILSMVESQCYMGASASKFTAAAVIFPTRYTLPSSIP